METTRFQGQFCQAVRFIWAGAKGYRNSDAEQTKWTLVQFTPSMSANGASTLNTGSEPTTGDMSQRHETAARRFSGSGSILVGPKLLFLQLFVIINQKIGCSAEALRRLSPSHRGSGALR